MKKYIIWLSLFYVVNILGCCGKICVGNDGCKWMSIRVKGGVYWWIVVKFKKIIFGRLL